MQEDFFFFFAIKRAHINYLLKNNMMVIHTQLFLGKGEAGGGGDDAIQFVPQGLRHVPEWD